MPHITDAISVTQARTNLKQVIDSVVDDYTTVAITRRGEGAAALMSMDDYNGLLETVHLLFNPKGAARLLRTINSVGEDRVEIDGDTFSKLADEDPDALWARIRDARRV
jgi:antitoxin YefM